MTLQAWVPFLSEHPTWSSQLRCTQYPWSHSPPVLPRKRSQHLVNDSGWPWSMSLTRKTMSSSPQGRQLLTHSLDKYSLSIYYVSIPSALTNSWKNKWMMLPFADQGSQNGAEERHGLWSQEHQIRNPAEICIAGWVSWTSLPWVPVSEVNGNSNIQFWVWRVLGE